MTYYICVHVKDSERGMSYLHYLCLLAIVVSNTYCVVFLLCFSSSCVLYVASFSGLSIFIALPYSLTFIYKMNILFFHTLYVMPLFYVQYLIPTIWWPIHSGLSRRPLLCVDAHDILILKLLEVSVMIYFPNSDSLIS